ncbi:hypothetical protein RRG08_030984 [Elysia crispata]|uniref:Uncharacterized protein n=1 Tax=Elysia crispata TaxID=231223 RepID=A0AAE0ZTT3_9GAST|nr:hypothetical protein RRG08_030984 [Elysia crispata]
MTTNQNPHIASVQHQAQWLDVCPKENLQSEQAMDQVVAPLYNWLKNGISKSEGSMLKALPALEGPSSGVGGANTLPVSGAARQTGISCKS